MPKKPRPPSRTGRKRRTLGWTLLTLGVIVTGLWMCSRWCSARVFLWRFEFGVMQGQLTATVDVVPGQMFGGGSFFWWMSGVMIPDARTLRWRVEPLTSGGTDAVFVWCQQVRHSRTGKTALIACRFVLWPLPPLLLPAGWMLRRSGIGAHRRANSLCPKCGYDLAGLAADAPCPECGKAEGRPRINADERG